MMDVEAIRSVEQNLGIESQLSTKYDFNLLIETSGNLTITAALYISSFRFKF